MAGAGLVAVAKLISGVAIGDPRAFVEAAVSGAIGLGAWWLAARDGSALPVVLAAVGGAILYVAVFRQPESVFNATLGVIVLGMAASLLVESSALVLAVSAAVFATLAWMQYAWMDATGGAVLVGSVVPIAVVFVGIQMIEWAKQEITGRQSRYENLFEHVPVAIWEEDFSRVAEWLDQLRNLGVTNVREYLSNNPDTVRYGASLIEVIDVNDETLRFLEAPSREAVLGPLNPDLIVENSLGALIEEIVAVWEGEHKLRIDMSGANLAGDEIEGFLLMTAPQTPTGIDWSRVVIAMVDVSEQLEAQRRLQELVDSKDRFIASVSHELRTPLTTVIGLAEELRHQNAAIGPQERDELLELIGDQAIEVGNLVEDLLVAAQANIGRVKMLLEPVCLSAELRSLLGLLDLPREPSIDIIGDIHPIADAQRLRQILRNLVSNANRYGGDVVLISARLAGDRMVLEVRDNGDGIPEELRERIFEPYQSAHHVAGLTESVGLGLTVSRELARLMDGDLTYFRTGATTVFQLTLPAVAVAGIDEDAPAAFTR